MFGLVALGMEDGSLCLVDLALDERENFASAVDCPADLWFTSGVNCDVAYEREMALRNKKHMCLQIHGRLT